MLNVGEAVLNHGTVNETWGYAENVTVKDTGDKTPIKEGSGDTTGVIYTDARKEVSGEYTPLAGAGDPVNQSDIVGSRLTLKTEGVDEIEIVVDDAEIAYKKGEVTTWKVNGVYYPNLPAAT